MAAPAQGISAKQATQIIDLLTDIRDALRAPAPTIVAGPPRLVRLAGTPLDDGSGRFSAVDECGCGSRLVTRQLGHDGSKTWHCRSCGASGHLPADAVV